ncbi:MAG TPA: ABC transporter permease [Firmicutes bacterium]|nr:ABC transporter permease [Bacillota bacterium]
MKRIRNIGVFFGRLWSHKQGKVGLVMVSFLILVAIFAPVIAPFNPYDVSERTMKGLSPNTKHLLGTTINTGQDIFSMLVYGTRVSLIVGVTSGVCIAMVGSVLGVAAGYIGGFVDTLIMRIVDIMLVIPTLPLVIVLTNVLGRDFWIIILIFVALGWTGLARTIRSLVLVLKNSNYVKAAELAGASRWHVMIRHILPGTSHLVIMSTALSSAGIMVAEAGLSFLGLGDPTAISWGKMLADAQSGGALLFGAWWWILAPGFGIFLAVFSFMRLGIVMEEIANPRMKQTSGVYKIFKSLDSSYVEDVFNSMDDYQQIGLTERVQRGGTAHGTNLEA